MTEISCHYQGCTTPSGFSLVCEYHRTRLTHSQDKRIMEIWHGIAIEKGRHEGEEGEWYECAHCKNPFTKEQVIGDHLFERSTHRRLKFDVRNSCCSCAPCNSKGSKTRAKTIKELRAEAIKNPRFISSQFIL